jgi:O-antigen/teichoic acid export membrane protein
MIKKIINTLFSQFFSAMMNFVVIILISHLLGTQGKGEQAIIAFNINIIMLFLTLLGNSTLIYLTPRKTFSSLFFPSFAWILIVSLVFVVLSFFFPFFQKDYIFQTIFISLLASINEINYYVLMGREKIAKANNIKIICVAVNVGVILLLWFFGKFTSIEGYLVSMWVAYIISVAYGIIILKKDYLSLHINKEEIKDSIKSLFSLGVVKQLGSIAQKMNYRVSFYIIALFCGKELLGIYSNSCALCEAVMLFGGSLALVQYSSLSNSQDNKQAKRLTINLTKVNCLFTFLALIFLCLMPKSFYVFLFGKGFDDVGYIIRILAIGIMFISSSSNFTQYFASRGNFSISAFASLFGLIVTLVFCFILIPKYNILGSAIAAVLSYITTFMIEFIYFLKWIKKE